MALSFISTDDPAQFDIREDGKSIGTLDRTSSGWNCNIWLPMGDGDDVDADGQGRSHNEALLNALHSAIDYHLRSAGILVDFHMKNYLQGTPTSRDRRRPGLSAQP